MSKNNTNKQNQFDLMRQKRFAPFFWTQFTGAANDNLFKFATTVIITYQLSVSWLPPAMAGVVIGALFILPFLLFSATSGQLADKLEKSKLIRQLKNFEIIISIIAAIGLIIQNVPILLLCIFLLGFQSAIFGPVKFAYLPQALEERELTGGNGMVEMGTFVAILLGNILGGILASLSDANNKTGLYLVAASCIAIAILGRISAGQIPHSPAASPELKINPNPITETWKNLKLAHQKLSVFRSLLGISWMWFYGAVFLSNFPAYAKDILSANEQIASMLLAVFSIGIATGSLLCEKLSHRHVEIGLVPIGAIGMTIFGIDLYIASQNIPAATGLYTVGQFLSQPTHYRIMLDLALLALSAGIYSVPMYALVQLRSAPTHRARIIAANNILNSLFMIISAIACAILLKAGYDVVQIFLATAILNAIVCTYIFIIVPEYLLRFIAWILNTIIYKNKINGEENIPENQAAILIIKSENESTNSDNITTKNIIPALATSSRPIYFITEQKNWLMKLAKSVNQIKAPKILKRGDMLGIAYQNINEQLINKIKDTNPEMHNANIIPIIIHKNHDVTIGKPISPQNITQAQLQLEINNIKKYI